MIKPVGTPFDDPFAGIPEGVEKPELVENSIDKDPDSSETEAEASEKSEKDATDTPQENI